MTRRKSSTKKDAEEFEKEHAEKKEKDKEVNYFSKCYLFGFELFHLRVFYFL